MDLYTFLKRVYEEGLVHPIFQEEGKEGPSSRLQTGTPTLLSCEPGAFHALPFKGLPVFSGE